MCIKFLKIHKNDLSVLLFETSENLQYLFNWLKNHVPFNM